MIRLIILDVLLWIGAAVAFFAYGQWIIALILALVAICVLGFLTGGSGGDTAFDLFDIFD